MVIYMEHPVHGRKVATLELEAAFDESNGWTRVPEVALPAPAPEPPASNALATRSRRRPE
jgi:hypothetical protein